MNRIIEEQLKKVAVANLDDYNACDRTYHIKKAEGIKVDVNSCYVIKLADSLLSAATSQVLSSNWNKGTVPPCACFKADVDKSMGRMIHINGLGYDPDSDADLDIMWSGWLPLGDIKVLRRI